MAWKFKGSNDGYLCLLLLTNSLPLFSKSREYEWRYELYSQMCIFLSFSVTFPAKSWETLYLKVVTSVSVFVCVLLLSFSFLHLFAEVKDDDGRKETTPSLTLRRREKWTLPSSSIHEWARESQTETDTPWERSLVHTAMHFFLPLLNDLKQGYLQFGWEREKESHPSFVRWWYGSLEWCGVYPPPRMICLRVHLLYSLISDDDRSFFQGQRNGEKREEKMMMTDLRR